MDRQRLEELLTGLMDEDLASDERAELDRELEASEGAGELLEAYRRQAASLKTLGSPQLSSEQREAVLQKIKSAPVPVRPPAGNNLLWFIGTIAACFLFFSASMALRPVRSGDGWKLYLSNRQLHSDPIAQTHQVVLKPNSDETRILESAQIDGFLTEGAALAILECDGGETAGQRLRPRLSFDLDGDQEFDVIQESETFRIDGKPGYESIAARFPSIPTQFHGQPLKGKTRLELIGDSMAGDGLSLLFRPDQSSLTLPVRPAEVVSKNSTPVGESALHRQTLGES